MARNKTAISITLDTALLKRIDSGIPKQERNRGRRSTKIEELCMLALDTPDLRESLEASNRRRAEHFAILQTIMEREKPPATWKEWKDIFVEEHLKFAGIEDVYVGKNIQITAKNKVQAMAITAKEAGK